MVGNNFPISLIAPVERARLLDNEALGLWRRWVRMMGYDEAIEIKMRRLFERLSEKDRRRYAGIEAAKLGHGGTEYIAGLFGLDPKTVRRGLAELEMEDDPEADRVRKKRRGPERGG
jgi:hypothetical protein